MSNNFILYRLDWNPAKDKYDKKPVGLNGEPIETVIRYPRSTVEAAVARLGDDYRVGIKPTVEDNMFFFDLDEAIDTTTGELTPVATALVLPFVNAGCYFEASSSGRGVHILGRYHGELPRFSNKRPSVHKDELYIRDQGCVLSADFQGSWDVDATPQLIALLRDHFPPRAAAGPLQPLTAGPRPEWRGPADDDVLISRMLSASGSAQARLAGKTSFAKLWTGDCEHGNESDLALASHLAFWTGCDTERIERLMRRSALARDKWDSHATYLQDLTIARACQTTLTVYREPLRINTAAALLGTSAPPAAPRVTPSAVVASAAASTDWFELIEQVVTKINAAPTYKELMTDVVSYVSSLGLPKLQGDTACATFKRKAETFGTTHSITDIRRLLMPPRDLSEVSDTGRPEWSKPLIYNSAKDTFFDTVTGSIYSHTGLRMRFSRYMTMKPNSAKREDPVEWLQDHWDITNVDDLEYRPDQPVIFEFSGRVFGNLFRPNTMPEPCDPSPEALEAMDRFRQHIYDVVNQRDDIYAALLGWLAHNVQFPGIKILWSPLIKGTGGDGKSIFGKLMRSAMGDANVKITSSSTVANKGGFTDWGAGKCVNIIEEIKLEGREARALYNDMKNLIGDTRIDLNKKGKASGDNLENITNHMAISNFNDAMPIPKEDRRLMVVFTPWESANDCAIVKGLQTANDLPDYFQFMGASMEKEPGAWRQWLLGIDLSSFKANGRAPWTPERDAMSNASGDFVEQTIEDCIARGGLGITPQVFVSQYLMGRVEISMGQKPDGKSWNRILSHLGYHQPDKTVWWNNSARRVWVKYSMENKQIQEFLNSTLKT